MTDAFIDLSTKTPTDTPFTVHGRSMVDPCKCADYSGGLPVYDFNGNVPGTKPKAAETFPMTKPLTAVRGDQWEGKYLFTGKVWTPTRPIDADGNLLYAASETPPAGETASAMVLPDEWERTNWFSQVRATYTAAIRYYNGWIPWYGLVDQTNWWLRKSKGADLVCRSEYSDQYQGTIVTAILSSNGSYRLYPSPNYYKWSLVRGNPSVIQMTDIPVPDDQPIEATGWANLHTMVVGPVTINPSWTVVPIDFPDDYRHLGNEPSLDENVWIRPPTPDPNWMPPPTPDFAPLVPVEPAPEVTP
jgi:hypothetical protein